MSKYSHFRDTLIKYYGVATFLLVLVNLVVGVRVFWSTSPKVVHESSVVTNVVCSVVTQRLFSARSDLPTSTVSDPVVRSFPYVYFRAYGRSCFRLNDRNYTVGSRLGLGYVVDVLPDCVIFDNGNMIVNSLFGSPASDSTNSLERASHEKTSELPLH